VSWSALGLGANGPVRALAVFDDGGGPALHAGGFFTTAGGVAAKRIARWNGSGWTALGGGTSGPVLALAVFDDGSGPALYAGGDFKNAGGIAVNGIARWDGSSWTALAGGVIQAEASVYALTVHDDGSGPALFAGGSFGTAGGVAARNIARWNGSSWSPLGSGVGGFGLDRVEALAAYDDGGGPALYAGGTFTSATDSSDSFLAKWGCPDSVPPVISCPPPIYAPDRNLDGQEVVYFTVTATDAIDPAPLVACVPPSGSTFPLGTTLVTCTATDAQGNASTCEFPVTVSLKARRR
jgi:hypothetical protein